MSRPNVLWLFADQHRYDALSCSGNPDVSTPNIDRLAEEGVRCTNAYSHCPVCIPFRAGLMTGQYATTCGVPRHGDFLHPHRRTIAHAFREAGYRTSYVGKWHLAGEHGTNMVSDRGWAGEDFWVHPDLRGGFQDWYGFNLSNNFYRTFYSHGEQVKPFEVEGYQTDGLTDLSLRYLSEYESGQPWFHVLSVEAPHPGAGGDPKFPGHPVPEKYEEMFDPASIELRANVPKEVEDRARQKLCGYYAMIANLDDNIGRVLKWLDGSGQAENTLVVFFSDHGDMMGSQGRMNKEVPYEESIHVPLIARLPSALPAGRVYDGIVSGIDIYPTCAGICHVQADGDIQGLDLSGSLDGTGGNERAEALVQWAGQSLFGFGDHPYRAIRTSRHTYTVGRDPEFCLLFDHDSDPFEMNNLFGDPASVEVQKTLHARLRRAILHAGEPIPAFIDPVESEPGVE
ncbi:MAG: sulfatase [Planctomycetota bacterium]|nr:sulfatase [Planctomycetota bacterium]MDP7131672.1 sulfatase [Planctomycetota bacterium]MDP7248876.1 sulfatase [Planctomycetota bacterium]